MPQSVTLLHEICNPFKFVSPGKTIEEAILRKERFNENHLLLLPVIQLQ